MIGGGVRIGCVVRGRWIEPWHWGGHQFPGARDVGLAAGAGQQPELAIGVYQVWAVAYQTAGISKLAEPSDRRNAIVPFQRHQLFTLGHEQYASPSINASA